MQISSFTQILPTSLNFRIHKENFPVQLSSYFLFSLNAFEENSWKLNIDQV